MSESRNNSALDEIDHIAVSVSNVADSVAWYRRMFRCEIAYEDETWELLRFGNCALALVVADQHPPHIGFVTPRAAEFGPLKTHRDGTRSTYVEDPGGNAVELLEPYVPADPVPHSEDGGARGTLLDA